MADKKSTRVHRGKPGSPQNPPPTYKPAIHEPPKPGTIGELEQMADIGPDLNSRVTFWDPFMRLGDGALDAGVAELRRIITAKQEPRP
jgi:hypothetical protein